jgi:hypothetical protein
MMGDWKKRKLVKGARASREAGRKKGLVPPAWAKYCAKAARAYKNQPDLYGRWSDICNGGKVKWKAA